MWALNPGLGAEWATSARLLRRNICQPSACGADVISPYMTSYRVRRERDCKGVWQAHRSHRRSSVRRRMCRQPAVCQSSSRRRKKRRKHCVALKKSDKCRQGKAFAFKARERQTSVPRGFLRHDSLLKHMLTEAFRSPPFHMV